MTHNRRREATNPLAHYEAKLHLVRDFTRQVAGGDQTGFYLWGRAGIGKSWTVIEVLQELGCDYRLSNTQVTPRALFDLLHRHPDAIHLFEDVEYLVRQRGCMDILRSALWGSRRGRNGRMERLMTWNARGASEEFIFSGGIILTGNRRPNDLPEVAALTSRIGVLELAVSDAEMAALIEQLAATAPPPEARGLSPQECQEVAAYVIEQCRELNRRLDIRVYVNACADRLQYEELEADCSWKDHVDSRLRGRPALSDPIEPSDRRAERREALLEVVRQICDLPRDARRRAWVEQTGLSEAAYYRWASQVGERDGVAVE